MICIMPYSGKGRCRILDLLARERAYHQPLLRPNDNVADGLKLHPIDSTILSNEAKPTGHGDLTRIQRNTRKSVEVVPYTLLEKMFFP